MEKVCLSTKNITIEFPGVLALSNVNFEADMGMVHAVVGANGAGKSTLMKVLTGVYNTYSGEIYLGGEKQNIKNPHDAQSLGIQIVHQEVDAALAPALSVAENIMINEMVNMMGKHQFINWKKIYAEADKKLQKLNIQLDVKEKVKKLTLAQKQMVLIARALMDNIKFLILDEPTAPLSQKETEELFRVIKQLTGQGVGIIFISHRLPEVFQISQKITVMRNGEIVAEEKTEEVQIKQIVDYMLGREFGEAYPKQHADVGEKLLEVKELTTAEGEVRDINMYVRAGEIVGVAGLVGAGKSELCKTLFGEYKIRKGNICIKGADIQYRNPGQAVKKGLALVPEERRKEGILIQEAVYSNLSVAKLSRCCNKLGFLQTKKEHELAKEIIKDLGIKCPNENVKVKYLSGGNQQKVAIGKWLVAEAEVYIFDEPTKGVDVGAKQDIFRLIGQLAKQGKGIIYATCETGEILGISDRIYVMYDHTIVGELETQKTDEKQVLYLSTGGK